MATCNFIDDMIKEYLAFRQLTATLKSLDLELKTDKDKGFRIDKLIEQLNSFVSNHELVSLREYWCHLDRRFFSRLPQRYSLHTRKLEVNLLKTYLVIAYQNNKVDKVIEFFEKMTPELQNQSEWKDWFALPYIKAAEENPAFSTYFTRQWQDIFWLSLHNFLAAIFQALPKPQLMQYEAEQQRFKELLDENARLREQLAAAVSGEQTAGAAKSKQEKMEDEDFISTGSDLMDDFFCIARESPPSSASESKGIKSFIKNISLPSVSPTLSKKPTPLTTVAVSQTQPTTTQSQIPKRTSATSPSDERSSLSTAANGKVNSRGSQLQQPPSRQRSRHITPTGSIAKPSPIASGNSPRSEQVAPSERSKQQRLQQERQDMERQRQELLSNSSEATKLKTNAKEEIKSPTSPPPEISENSMGEEEESKEAPPFLLLSQDEYREHQSAIVHCRFSPLAGMVASCDLDGIVKVWSVSPVPSTVVVVMTKSPLQTLEWSGKMDRYLLLGSRMGTVRMFDTVEKKNLNEIIVDQSFPRVLSIASSPSGASFVCSCAAKPSTELQWDQCKGRMYVCSTKNMKIERLLPLDSDDRCVNCTAFNHNGNLLVTGSTGGVISLYDMQRNESIASWKAHQGQVHSVRFSEDENSCYSMGSDGKFVQWSLLKRSGRRLVELGIHNGATGPFNAVGMGGKQQSFTPRGNLFSFDSTGKHVLTCAPSGGLIYKLGPDGSMSRVVELAGHKAPVSSVDWSVAMDCGTCLTGSLDGRIRVSVLLAQ